MLQGRGTAMLRATRKHYDSEAAVLRCHGKVGYNVKMGYKARALCDGAELGGQGRLQETTWATRNEISKLRSVRSNQA